MHTIAFNKWLDNRKDEQLCEQYVLLLMHYNFVDVLKPAWILKPLNPHEYYEN